MSLSDEKIKELDDKCKSKEQELLLVRKTTEEQTWQSELNELKDAYIKWNDAYKIDNTLNQPKKMKNIKEASAANVKSKKSKVLD